MPDRCIISLYKVLLFVSTKLFYTQNALKILKIRFVKQVLQVGNDIKKK